MYLIYREHARFDREGTNNPISIKRKRDTKRQFTELIQMATNVGKDLQTHGRRAGKQSEIERCHCTPIKLAKNKSVNFLLAEREKTVLSS